MNESRRYAIRALGGAALGLTTLGAVDSAAAASSYPTPRDSPRQSVGYLRKIDVPRTGDRIRHFSTNSVLNWHGAKETSDAWEHVFTISTAGSGQVKPARLLEPNDTIPMRTGYELRTNIVDRYRYGEEFTIVPYPNSQYQRVFPTRDTDPGGIPDMIETGVELVVGRLNPYAGAALSVASMLDWSSEEDDGLSESWSPSYGWEFEKDLYGGADVSGGGHSQRFHVEVPKDRSSELANFIVQMSVTTRHSVPYGPNNYVDLVTEFGASFPEGEDDVSLQSAGSSLEDSSNRDYDYETVYGFQWSD